MIWKWNVLECAIATLLLHVPKETTRSITAILRHESWTRMIWRTISYLEKWFINSHQYIEGKKCRYKYGEFENIKSGVGCSCFYSYICLYYRYKVTTQIQITSARILNWWARNKTCEETKKRKKLAKTTQENIPGN